jgi:hypothetical protein
MSKKKLQTTAIANELEGASVFFSGPGSKPKATPPPQAKASRKRARPTQESTRARQSSRETSRDSSRGKPRSLPTRDEIQEFSFRLRDELKVKVQAEVPHRWQDELEEIARQLNVRKLELYRFILGEFLGKVKRKEPGP